MYIQTEISVPPNPKPSNMQAPPDLISDIQLLTKWVIFVGCAWLALELKCCKKKR